jgi:Ala-tRNA(Pro) deacylase
MEIKLYSGRPETNEGRSEKEIKVYDFLEKAGVSFERADHEPAMTMEVCEKIDGALGALICKNLFLCNRQCTSFYLLMMPGDKPFKTKDLSAQIDSSRLSFASPENMEKYIGTTPGSASVLGLVFDTEREVRLLIDADVLKSEYFGCHPCENTSSLKILTSDLVKKILPALGYTYTVVEL